MNKEYGYTKQAESNHQGSRHTLAILLSKLRSSLEAAWSKARVRLEYAYSMLMTTFLRPFSSKRAELERRLASDEITARPQRDYGSLPTTLRLVMSLLLLMVGVNGVWGQIGPVGTDYSGTYYIANHARGAYSETNRYGNFYLCPSTNMYAVDQPFLTTFKVRSTDNPTPQNAKWTIEFAKTEDNVDYYYLIHSSNKYLTWHDAMNIGDNGNKTDRVRLHLQSTLDESKALFYFTEGNKGENDYNICLKGVKCSRNTVGSLNPAKDNVENYAGVNQNWNNVGSFTDPIDGTTRVWCGGLIGIFEQNDPTGVWYLEEVKCKTPVITYSSETGKVTITSATEGASIYYTTNGSTPTSSSTPYNDTPFDLTSSITTIKAIAVKDWMDDSDVATVTHVPNPTITLTIPDGGYTYDKTEKEPEVSLKNGETPISSSEYEVSYTDNINAGTATATVTISDAEGGDYIVSGSTTFSIAPKTLNVTADAKTKGYGDSDPEFTYTATELVEGDVLEGTLSRAEGENVGNYAISQGTLANSNYSITFTSADLTITSKSLGSGGDPAENITIDVDNDGNNFIVTVKQGENTLTQGTDYTWTGSGDEFEYTVTVTGTGNYSGSAQATYIAATPGYYALHQNGQGYLKVSGAGVNLGNDGTFQSGNLFDKGNCIWYMTPQGYLQNEYFYLNVANNKTLYLSVNPVTRWRSEDVTGENTNGKKHLKINNGTQDLYLCNEGNSITLKTNPTAFYSACPVTVEEVSWNETPAADNLTVQSPQLVTYLRAYFTQKIKYNFHNDAGAEVKSTDGKHERRVYATIAYKEGGNKGTDWDIDESGILYNKKASGDIEFTATYNILPADPVALSAHSTAATKDIKYKVTQKPLAPTAGTDYLLYSISGGDSYRYPYDDGVTDGDPVKPDGKGGTGDSSVLTDPVTDKNLQISWKITVDAEGFYTFQNSSTGKYLYYDETAHTSSDFGVLRLSSAPTGNSAKFRLYKTSDTNYSECYYLIPYSKLFAVYKSNAVADGLYVALNNKDYTGDTPVISLSKPNANSTWCIYKYEAEYRIREDFTITGPSSAEAVGNYNITSEGWYGRYIKQSPRNGSGQRGLVIKGTYNDNVDYIWTVTGLGNYINISDGTNTDGTWSKTTNGNANNRKLVVNVTSLPVSSTSGVIKLKLSGCSAPSENVKTSSEKTFAFTIFGDGTVSFTEITSLAGITSSSGAYRLVGGNGSNFAYSDSNKPGITTFSGVLDGNNQTISGLNAPLFDNLSNGTVRNVNLSGVGISNHSGPTGAIAGTADGGSRIYNVGILDGEVGSNGDVCGGLVGKLDGSARVINCFSYATITGGTTVGGIVGNNTYASKSNDMRTMVMNCMFYGDITGGNSKAPIYNGQIITNRSDENGVGNFNYFWAGASYVQGKHIDVYNCALSAETRFLQRFEFFRHLLNSNRALAAWWATGSRDKKNEMQKWVLEPSQIGTATPYPILKPFDKYPSVVNIDADHAEDFSADADTKKTQYNQGRKFGTLTINIQNATSGSGSDAPSGANITTNSVTPNITDKDPAHFNFNYYKVQLPYYNDVGTKNYTDNKVVTGWKIVTISGGTNTYSTDNDNNATTPADATASVNDNGDITLTTPYNFADRKCTDKDKFEVSGRVFSQGAYFDVPEGVSSITIEPYWGKCVYVSDQYPDVVYNQGMSTAANVTTVGGGERYKNNTAYDINDSSQKVYTTMGNAVTALDPSGSVYDNAIVLVGNVHSLDLSNKTNSKPYTIMSIDLDSDNEPDYSYILRFNNRNRVHPVRIDFLSVIGLGMAQKSKDGTGTYNFGIMQPFGWFECTNTGLFRVTQLEYDYKGQNGNAPRLESPMILQGGVIEQWVTVGGKEVAHKEAKSVTYYHVGGNVWFKEFHIGVHQDKTEDEFISPHPPISVTGGDFDEFYLTGMYNTPNTNYPDNAECYINGGRFGKVAGTGMQGLGNAGGAGVTGGPAETGNIIWQINNADIDEFYAGGINAAHIATGNIRTVISNSRVDLFCGGPKFGNMTSTKTVVTNATNCTFRTFFGAGYGGNSYNRRYPFNRNDVQNTDWNGWVSTEYTNKYDSKYGGVETRIDYQFIPMSSNTSNVARLYVDYVNFSLATTHDVTSKLTDCTITTSTLGRLELFSQSVGNFYGGGSLGMVNGPVKSTLTNCTVEGNVFGGGYSATLPTVAVMNNSFKTEPHYDSNLGAYLDAELPTTEAYTWEHATEAEFSSKQIDTGKHILYTTENLTGLGAVTGNVTLTIDGNTTLTNGKRMSVAKSVYGGGEESNVLGDTRVNMNGGTIAQNVFGGGKGVADEFACSKAMIGIEGEGANNANPEATKDKGTKVSISDGTVNGNVYGGGEVGRVEWNTQVTIGEENGTGTPVINGCVYGAGKGLKTHGYAALVRGNPTVTIQGNAKIKKSVYGGGEIASVARYKVASTAEEAAENGVEIGMPYALANNYSGNCKVIVGGNAVIGPDTPMKMYHPEITDGTDKPDDAGHVFAAGKGVLPEVYTYEDNEHRPKRMLLYNAESLPTYWEYADEAEKNIWEYFEDEEAYFAFIKTLALSSQTEVTIKDNAFVKGSVYGGSENGLVQFDTDVKIQGGQIGCGKDATEPYGDEVWANDYTPSGDLECASWSYEAPYAPYDPNANATGDLDKYSSGKSTEGGRRIATDGHTYYGNVFGGGSGSVPYFDTQQGISRYVSSAGMVKGNTKVTISGGHILTNVYGGCEATNVLGSATITMTGGTVGVPRTLEQIVAHPVTCYIFGAGKGDQRIFFNKETNVDRTTVSIEGGKVYGSVFGGGEDGHVFQNTTVNIGTTEGEGPTIGTLGTSYVDGNVFGGGRGFSGDALTAGNVGGSVELNIKSGKILGSVYGGGRLASVGYGLYLVDEEITEDEKTIKPYGILRPNGKYDGSYPDPSSDPASTYYNNGRGYITINISGGTIGNNHEYIYNPTAAQKAAIPNTTFDYQNHLQYTKGGNVFTGGMGRLYALDNTTLLPLWPKLGKCKGTTLNMTGGTVKSSIYGGGEIGAVAENATVNIKGGTVGTKVVDSEDATKYYYFGSVFGGGKGSVDNITYPSTTPEEEQIPISEAGTTGGNVQVNLNEDVASDDDAKGAIVRQVFGCNDMNGSPKGTVTVHVYATQNADKDKISVKPDKETDTYDVMAVYGGGNLAAYEPTDLTTGKTNVIIDGCGLTSIRQVYGGGNAASTPATDVEINGTYEIEEVFGGGNGLDALPNGRPNPGANVGYKNYTIYEQDGDVWKAKDDPDYDTKEERTAEGSSIVYGTGAANVNINGGTIHRVFGGSNTKGNVRITAVTMLEEAGGCPFCVDEAYGGGKSAPMDAEAKLLMACIPGLKEAYGGAQNAEIDGDVTLNITNGTFERIFGGNDEKGYIKGTITVNIEETGCKPIIIGELYGGGNQAPYTAPEGKHGPTLNVRSFTSIGDIYGGGLGATATVTGNTYVNINVSEGRWRDGTYQYATTPSVIGVNDKIAELNGKGYQAPAFTSGMGAIHTVFGGGNAAPVAGNTNVNVATSEYEEMVSVATGDNVTDYYIRSGEGTEASPYTYTEATGTAVEGTTYYQKVKGANITGNVYGGGNNAEVTGNTHVVIGKKYEAPAPTP